MENKGKLLFFVFILLVILGIFGYFYMTKSQIERDFEIYNESYIYADLVYEVNSSAYVFFTWEERIFETNGTFLLAAIPYYYNNMPYIILINHEWNYTLYNNIIVSSNYTVSIYNPITKEIIDQVYFSGPAADSPSAITAVAYDIGNRKIISIARNGVPLQLSKIVIEDANIKEVRECIDCANISNRIAGRGISVYFSVLLEGNNTDYVVVVYENTSVFPHNIYLRIYDEYGNLLQEVIRSWSTDVMLISYFESKNYVFVSLSIDDYTRVYTILLIYNKNNKSIYLFEDTIYVFKPYMPTYLSRLFGDYDKDIAAVVTEGRLYIYTEKTGVNVIDMGWVAPVDGIMIDNKIMLYISTMYYQTNIDYWLYNYSIDNNTINIYLLSRGILINTTTAFLGEDYYYILNVPRVTPVYVHNNMYDIISSWNSSIPLGFVSSNPYGSVDRIIYMLLDVNNYRIYPTVVYDRRTNVSYGMDPKFRIGMYNHMYLSPIICEISSYRTGPYEYPAVASLNTSCKVYMLYLGNIPSKVNNITNETQQLNETVTNETIITNETNVTLQPQPRPQPGFGVEITPTPTEINITYPNVTQNVTVTRPTGIQSVIEIMRRNWWIILLAILLLILIAAGLRRRTA